MFLFWIGDLSAADSSKVFTSLIAVEAAILKTFSDVVILGTWNNNNKLLKM